LRTAKSVCQGCATGCNAHLDYDPRYNKAYRYRPRDNEAVNKYWMCDEGMLTYKEAHDGRIVEASVSGKATTVAKALDEARALFSGVAPASVAIVLGARHSLEDNWALRELGTVLLGTKSVHWSGRADGYHDDILIHRDKNANTKGVQQLVPGAKPLQSLVDDVKASRVTHVIALGADAAVDVSALGAAKLVVVAAHQGPLAGVAAVVLPATSWAEHSGTYVNAKGLRQTSDPALQPLGASKPAYKVLAELATALGYEPSWSKLAQIRTHVAGGAAASAGSSGGTNVGVVA
jgi:NADH-quinone oxidoreductase subunit G